MISTLQQAAHAAHLIGINFHNVSGRRKEDVSKNNKPDVAISIATTEQHDEKSLSCRFSLTADHPEADYSIEVEIRYELSDSVQWSEDLLRGFIEEIAIMAAFPYLREGLAGTAARLGADVPFLGILRRGEFQMGEAKNQ